jgi:hypothetical protein
MFKRVGDVNAGREAQKERDKAIVDGGLVYPWK